jgi:hypothetical protein
MAVVESDLRRLGEDVPEGDCVFAIKPSVVACLSGRVSKRPPAVQADAAAFERALRAGGCRYLYLLALASPSYPVVMYPHQRLEGRLDVVRTARMRGTEDPGDVVGVLARLR